MSKKYFRCIMITEIVLLAVCIPYMILYKGTLQQYDRMYFTYTYTFLYGYLVLPVFYFVLAAILAELIFMNRKLYCGKKTGVSIQMATLAVMFIYLVIVIFWVVGMGNEIFVKLILLILQCPYVTALPGTIFGAATAMRQNAKKDDSYTNLG